MSLSPTKKLNDSSEQAFKRFRVSCEDPDNIVAILEDEDDDQIAKWITTGPKNYGQYKNITVELAKNGPGAVLEFDSCKSRRELGNHFVDDLVIANYEFCIEQVRYHVLTKPLAVIILLEAFDESDEVAALQEFAHSHMDDDEYSPQDEPICYVYRCCTLEDALDEYEKRKGVMDILFVAARPGSCLDRITGEKLLVGGDDEFVEEVLKNVI